MSFEQLDEEMAKKAVGLVLSKLKESGSGLVEEDILICVFYPADRVLYEVGFGNITHHKKEAEIRAWGARMAKGDSIDILHARGGAIYREDLIISVSSNIAGPHFDHQLAERIFDEIKTELSRGLSK